MQKTVFRLITIMLFLLLISSISDAGTPFDKWEPITATDWAVGQDSASKDFDAVMIFEKIVSDEKKLEDEECYRTIYCRIRILNANGSKYADIPTPYFYLDQKLKEIRGRTILRDGAIAELSPTQIFEKEVVKTKGAKFKQKSFSLPGVTNDCIIEYVLHYQLSDNVFNWVVQKEIPLLKGELLWKFGQFTAPEFFSDLYKEFLTPNYLWLNYTSKPKITHLPSIKKTTELFFEIDSVPAFDDEPFSAAENSLKCRLVSYYGTNEPASTFWGEQATSRAEYLADFCNKNKEVKRVTEQFKGLDSVQTKINAAYKWIQDSISNTDYLDEVEETNSETKKAKKIKVNKSADDVIKRRYGDRGDINMVFCDMLREMNIDAKIAFVRDRREDLLVQKAKYWQFDYSLVAIVEADGLYRIYAPGFVNAVVGQVPWFCEGITALVAGADEYFVPVPFSYEDENITRINYSMKLTDDFQVIGYSKASYTGQAARIMRRELVDEAETDHNILLLDLFEADQPEAERDSITFANFKETDQDFLFNCHVTFPALTGSSDRLILNPFEFMASAENPFHESERTWPVLFDFAYILNEDLEISLPPNWKIEALPGNDIIQSKIGSCEVFFSALDSSIVVKRIFRLYAPFWGLDKYPLVRDLFEKQHSFAGLSIILVRKEN